MRESSAEENLMESGILYVIFNKWISDLVSKENPFKIGITKNTIEDRYYGLGLKMPGVFEVYFAYEIEDYRTAEKLLKGIVNNFCVNGEWFRLTQKELDLVKANCEAMGGALITDDFESEIIIDTEISFSNTEDESELINQIENLKMPLENMIKTIGMKTFVEYFDKLRNEPLRDIIEYMKQHEDYKINSIRAKASTGKRIFKMSMEKKALEIISKSERVDNQTKEKAVKLLNEYKGE